ncbi:MAG: hypothetical protein ACUVX8_07950, partial [Candidatus Zipacnadales bacterium]
MIGVIVNTDSFDRAQTRRVVSRLLTAQIPFAFVLSGHRYYDQALDLTRLARFQALIHVDDLRAYPKTVSRYT